MSEAVGPAHESPDATDISVVVLTYNEERNISECLRSSLQLTSRVLVVDSFSTDATLAIADSFDVPVFQNVWSHWADQRNWAMDHVPIDSEWILFLDADETLTEELRAEMRAAVRAAPAGLNGFYNRRRFVFLGRWLRHGGYANIWVLRLVRHGCARVVPAAGREYFEVEGRVERLRHDMIHDDHKPISAWVAKHDHIAGLEAENAGHPGWVAGAGGRELEGSARNRLRHIVVDRTPLTAQSFLLFTYRYVVRLGFLDGWEGFAYYFLHDLWFPFLIAVKHRELRLHPVEAKGNAGE